MNENEYEKIFEKFPDIVEVDDLREMLGNIGRNKAYELLISNSIHSIRIGRKYKIPKQSVIQFLLINESGRAV